VPQYLSTMSAPNEQVFKLLRSVVDVLQQEHAIGTPNGCPVIKFCHPAHLKDKILSLKLGKDEKTSDEDLILLCKDIIKYSVRTGHPYFLNQLYGGLDPYGLAGALISEALNTNQYTFEVAPTFTLCEMEVIRNVLGKIGFSNGDGIFTPGGSLSNMYAVVLAKYKKNPSLKQTGLSGLPPFVIFTSQDAHYSILKSANWLGIGTDNVVQVKTDEKGRMIPEALKEEIQKAKDSGKEPLMVNSTAGTTVLGAFDPFEEISKICEEFRIWLHVDACWGGTLMFSERYKHLLNGINLANSVSWNPHKMLGAPLQCSLLLVKEKGLLDRCNCARATYLFQQDKMYDVSYDTGDKSVQCGRKVDAFKLWLMWKARGDNGFGELIDQAMKVSRYFLEKIRNRPGFMLVLDDYQCTNIAFWFIPPRLRNQPIDDKWWEEISQVAPKLKEKLVLAGTLMIGYQPLSHKNLKNFFRLVVTCHPPLSEKNIDYVIDQIELHGSEL